MRKYKVIGTGYCIICKLPYDMISPKHKICSQKCRDKRYKKNTAAWRSKVSPGTVGTVSELIVCSDLLKDGWQVFRAVAADALYDIVAIRGEEIRRLEVRTGTRTPYGLAHSMKVSPAVTHFAVYLPEEDVITYIPV